MGSFFNPEKGVWSWLSTMVDICGLSLLWAGLCLPVVTIGPATAALYFAVVTCVRRREAGAFKSFLRSFRENLRVGIPASVIAVAVAALVLNGYLIMVSNGKSDLAFFMYAAYYVAMVVPLGTICYLFPLLGRFTFGLKDLFRTAFQLAMRHLPSTVIIVLLILQMVGFTARWWIPILFTPALTTLLVSLFLEKNFQKYVPELVQQEEPVPEEDIPAEE